MISKCLGNPFEVRDSLRKDTRDIEQICLSSCLLTVIKIIRTAPTGRLCSLLCFGTACPNLLNIVNSESIIELKTKMKDLGNIDCSCILY